MIDPRLSACFKPDNVCQPGNTLLWDLLQDDKICHLGEGLALEAEKTLCNLICFMPDKDIRMKFIEGIFDVNIYLAQTYCNLFYYYFRMPK